MWNIQVAASNFLALCIFNAFKFHTLHSHIVIEKESMITKI